MERDLRLIVNPTAGAGRAARLLPAVEAELRALGLRFRVDRTESMDHARELAREGAQAGEIVAAMGGDGLTGAVAGELRDGAGVLAVLPGGRGNDFARKLGVEQDPVAALAHVAAGRERRIDLADVGGRGYLGILSAGLDSDANALANSTRLPLGTGVYAYAALRALAAWKPARWTVTTDGEAREFDGYSVAVGNSGVYGSGMFLMPDAEIDDGMLDVVFCEAIPKRRYLVNLPRVFKGTHVNEPGMHLVRARSVTFSADRPFTAYADGDPIAELPATVTVLPGTLRVLAPS
jgi:YegS/Rv2252/BmrU family lipid kinase